MVSYGWIAAFVSCLAFGSFAVPIKSDTANRVNIDPLVMQSYKTGMCFITCWMVLLRPGEQFTFTPWGIVSGLFWVPGGTAGIYAVRNAGLAVSQGMWSTLKILVAFVWGIFIFEERVETRMGAILAVLLMMMGLWGMSYYSSAASQDKMQSQDEEGEIAEETGVDNSIDEMVLVPDSRYNRTRELTEPLLSDKREAEHITVIEEAHNCEEEGEHVQGSEMANQLHQDDRDDMVEIGCGVRIRRQRLGRICAAFDGIWGGSILVPMHFARANTEGLGYVISFAIGASIILLVMWMFRFGYHLGRTKSLSKSFESLPGFHLRCMWLPGGLAGILWSIGNISSMLAVEFLGEGVGYSIVQSQMLVAGLWGLLWFREIQEWDRILKWLLSGCITVGGILLLSHEHLK